MADPTDLDWLTPLADRGPVPGLRTRLTITWLVQKGPDGDLRVSASFEPDPTHATDGEPAEVELTCPHPIAVQLASGEVTPNVAWMSGRLKASGPTGPLLAVLAEADAAA